MLIENLQLNFFCFRPQELRRVKYVFKKRDNKADGQSSFSLQNLLAILQITYRGFSEFFCSKVS
jgi:hypothetical protein